MDPDPLLGQLHPRILDTAADSFGVLLHGVDSQHLQPGDSLGIEKENLPDRYERLAPPIRGGRGTVIKVFDRISGGSLALKTVAPNDGLPGTAEGEIAVEFLRLLSFGHPVFPAVQNFGRLPSGTPYYTMEWIEGKTADKFIKDQESFIAAPALVARVCRVFEFLHDQGLVYMDLKPAHVLVNRTSPETSDIAAGSGSGTVPADAAAAGPNRYTLRILDPGLCLDFSGGPSPAGGISGTFPYIAPEVLRGRKIDGRADLFSAGVLLLELLTGVKPFMSSSIESTARRILETDPLAGVKIPAPGGDRLLRILDTLLAGDPSRRCGSAGEAARMLEEWVAEFTNHPMETKKMTFPAGAHGERAGETVYCGPVFTPQPIPAPFTSRAGPVKDVMAAGEEALKGNCVVLTVSGSAGVGATRFLEEIAGRLSTKGFTHVPASYAEGPSASPEVAGDGGYVADSTPDHVSGSPSDPLIPVSGSGGGSICSAVAAILSGYSGDPDPAGADRADQLSIITSIEARSRGLIDPASGVVRLVGRLASAGPLLLTIDAIRRTASPEHAREEFQPEPAGGDAAVSDPESHDGGAVGSDPESAGRNAAASAPERSADSLRRLLDGIIAALPDSRILVIANVPGIALPGSTPADSVDRFVSIEPFTRDETAKLIEGAAGKGAALEPLVKAVHGVADGRPGLVLQYTEWLLNKGILSGSRDGGFNVDEALLGTALPGTILELAAGRMADLSRPARDLLAKAVLSEQPVKAGFLARLGGTAGPASVEELVSAGLLREKSSSGCGFLVTDDAVRKVVFREISPERKRFLHTGIADVIARDENLFKDDRNGRLAFHFSEAGAAKEARGFAMAAAREAVRAENTRKAARFYGLALRNTDAGSEPREYASIASLQAAACFENGNFARAGELYATLVRRYSRYCGGDAGPKKQQARGEAASSPPSQVTQGAPGMDPPPPIHELRRSAAMSKARLGDLDAAMSLLAENLRSPTLPSEEKILSAFGVIRISEIRGEYSEALETAENIRPVVNGSGNTRHLAELDSMTGNILAAKGLYEKARRFHMAGLAARLSLGSKREIANSWNNLSILSLREGNIGSATRCGVKALRIREETGDGPGAADTMNNLGVISAKGGRDRDAIDFFERCLALKREAGDVRGAAAALNNIALLHARTGELTMALAMHKDAESIRRRIGDRDGLSKTLNNRGLIHVRLEEWRKAAEAYDESLSLKRAEQDTLGAGRTLGNLGMIKFHLGNWSEAGNLLAESLAVAESLDDRDLAANAREGLGMIGIGQGRLGDAFEQIAKALDHRREAASPGPLSDTLAAMAELHIESGRSDQASDFAAEAVETASSMDDPVREAGALLLLARIRLAAGDRPSALEASNKAALLISGAGNSLLRGLLLRFEGETAFSRGDPGAAKKKLEKSLAILDRHDYLFEKADTLRALGLVAESAGSDSGRGHLAEAGAIFAQLGAASRTRRIRMDLDAAGAESTRSLQPDILYRISGLFTSGADIDRILSEALDMILAQVNAERGLIFILLGKDGDFELKARRNMDPDTIDDARNISRNIINRVYRDDEVLFSANAQDDARFSRFRSIVEHRILSFMCVPVRSAGKILGTIYLDNRSFLNPFRQDDADLLKAFAAIAGIAIENATLRETIRKKNTHLQREVEARYSFGNIVGRSLPMSRVFGIIEKVADIGTSILVEGETGTGKELIARAIHYNGARKDFPFVAVDCGLLSDNLMESELFGHVKGAFTGAVSDRKGLVELADRGTLFLDEISNLGAGLQAKLLRVLQEGEFRPLGGTRQRTTTARIVCATNTDLASAVENGEFREDLYFRINVISIRVPPLRERPEDIPLLVDHFLGRKVAETAREINGVTPEVMEVFMKHDWPGNVRELEHLLERMVVLSGGPVLGMEQVPGRVVDSTAPETTPGKSVDRISDLRTIEKRAILAALEKKEWHQTRAAGLLGITERNLRYKMGKYNITNRKKKRRAGPGKRS